MAEDVLFLAGDRVVIVADGKALDAATGLAVPMPESPESITVNNRIRGELAGALAALKLFDPDPAVRLASAQELQAKASAETAPLLAKALAKPLWLSKSKPALAHSRSTKTGVQLPTRFVPACA